MSINRLYHTWQRQITQLLPGERITRIRNFTWLVVGIYLSRSVHLSRIASKLPGQACLLSWAKRLSRLVDNPALQVRAILDPLARGWLARAAEDHGEVRLILDATRIGFGHQLILVGLAYRRRALPIAWTWVKAQKGHSSACAQLQLLRQVRPLLPSGARVRLVGDSEYGAVLILRQLDLWGWGYVLRQTAKHCLQADPQAEWQSFGTLVSGPGQAAWRPDARLTQRYGYPTTLLAYWAAGEKGPWLLATNLTAQPAALQAYRRRMWIEEMFGDWKSHGFDLEHTHLRHPDRLSRLTLAVALLYVWLVFTGERVVKHGQRSWVDRADRRDLSIFQIGLRWIERLESNQKSFPAGLLPALPGKLSGS